MKSEDNTDEVCSVRRSRRRRMAGSIGEVCSATGVGGYCVAVLPSDSTERELVGCVDEGNGKALQPRADYKGVV